MPARSCFSGVLAPSSPWRPSVVALRPLAANGTEQRPSTRPTKKKKNSALEVVFLPPANDDASAPAGPRTSLGERLVALGLADPITQARVAHGILRRITKPALSPAEAVFVLSSKVICPLYVPTTST